MTAKNFIFNQLRQLTEKFPGVLFSYEYRPVSNTHVIEVQPQDFFENNKDYLEEEYLLETTFYENFSSEEILFISSGSLIKLDNPEEIFGSLPFSFDSCPEENQLDIEALDVEVSFPANNLHLAKAA